MTHIVSDEFLDICVGQNGNLWCVYPESFRFACFVFDTHPGKRVEFYRACLTEASKRNKALPQPSLAKPRAPSLDFIKEGYERPLVDKS